MRGESVDVLSCAKMLAISQPMQFHLDYTKGLSASWTGFAISTTVAFSVINDYKDIIDLDNMGQVAFPKTVINLGNAWLSPKQFVTPYAGIYYFSFFSELKTKSNCDINLVVGKLEYQIFTCIQWRPPAGVALPPQEVIVSRSALFNLNKDTIVYVKIVGSSCYVKTPSFVGFLYSKATHSTAWCLYTQIKAIISHKHEISNKIHKGQFAQFPSIPFKDITIKLGSCSYYTTNEVEVTIGGIFYISFTITAEKGPVTVKLYIGNKDVSTLMISNKNKSYVPREKVLLYRLAKYNHLSVKLASGSIFTGLKHMNSFLRFLLFPE